MKCAVDYNRDGVTGKKAWFFLDKEIVCLGAGLMGNGQARLVTSIEQSLLRSDVAAGGEHDPGKKLGQEEQQIPGARWVWQDNQDYVFPTATNVMVSSSPQTGAWDRIYKEGSDDRIFQNVFSLWIEHNPATPAGYAYTIFPNVDARQTAAYAAQPTVDILANEARLQAVRDSDAHCTLAIFYAPGEINLPQGKLAVDKPCALLLREIGLRPLLSLADPAQKTSRLQISFRSKIVVIDLPQGNSAGKSVTMPLP